MRPAAEGKHGETNHRHAHDAQRQRHHSQIRSANGARLHKSVLHAAQVSTSWSLRQLRTFSKTRNFAASTFLLQFCFVAKSVVNVFYWTLQDFA
jgi:hypothetical protein